MRHIRLICISLVLIGSVAQPAAAAELDDYLVLNARINDRPVLLAVDTGAEVSCLFSPTVKRLGLQVTGPGPDVEPTPGKVAVSISEECTLTVEGMTGSVRTRFPVMDLPVEAASTRLDGLVGWAQIRDNRMQFNADTKTIRIVEQLPDNIDTWSRWPIHVFPEFNVLLIDTAEDPNETSLILIDTGSPDGIALSPQRWRQWIADEQRPPFTLSAFYTPAVGLKIYEQRWADRLTIDAFGIDHIPVHEQNAVFHRAIPNLAATLGLYGMSRLEVIIDHPGGFVYTRPRPGAVTQFQHNRAAAVFVPNLPHNFDLVAHVIENGPAWQAGIRDGDILLKIGDLDVTKWRTDPAVLPLSRFWEQPAGNALDLTLQRDQQFFTATVTLKELIPTDKIGRDSTRTR